MGIRARIPLKSLLSIRHFTPLHLIVLHNMPNGISNSPKFSSIQSGPSYVKGSKVLLSNKVLRSVEGLPSNMIDPMKLLRGRIIGVSSSNPRYKVQIWATTPDYMDTIAFGGHGSPPQSSITVDVDEKDIISQLTNGRNFPDLAI
ncbi:hypothetical protein FRB95_004731 [Tulasnella sp. JGI-2019a]|nr:hypothetical protein FRB95_004731 [Tulasnella sp. JGI-2019a]